MLGWEFPPYFAGGVGTVCYELTKSLVNKGIHVTYLMPQGPEDLVDNTHVDLLIASKIASNITINVQGVPAWFMPYDTSETYEERLRKLAKRKGGTGALYGSNLMEEIELFAQRAAAIAQHLDFDVIHAHDYLTFRAGQRIKELTGKPLVTHIHITQFDITGGEHADPHIYQMEREGMMASDRVIAISEFVKRRCVEKYYIPEEKIRVVYNSISPKQGEPQHVQLKTKDTEHIVSFLGRITLQKGPDYFVRAAQKVLEVYPHTKFVMAGTGHMLPQVIDLAANLGIADRFLFTGFYRQDKGEGDALLKASDVYVCPSVAEPFGILPLEAMRQGTPCIVSKQAGVSEIIKHCLKVDFWDVNDIANKIIGILTYKDMRTMMQQESLREIQKFTWDTPADACISIYNEVA